MLVTQMKIYQQQVILTKKPEVTAHLVMHSLPLMLLLFQEKVRRYCHSKATALSSPSSLVTSAAQEKISVWLSLLFPSRVFQVAPMIKNLPGKEGEARDESSTPRMGRSHEVGNGNSLHFSCLENPTEQSGRLQLMGSQRVGHEWVIEHNGAIEHTCTRSLQVIPSSSGCLQITCLILCFTHLWHFPGPS